jgi:hypothetical protein
MHRHSSWGRAALAAVLVTASGALGLAVTAPPAAAGTFTLTLTGPPGPPQIGQPMVLQATGTMPPEDVTFPYFMIVAAISRTVLPACPAGYWDGVQIANSTGGGIIDLSRAIRPDVTGAWSAPIGITPWLPGTYLIGAYGGAGAHTTLAAATYGLDVPAPVVRPASVAPPRVVRAGATATCQPGRWSAAPTRYAYAWLVDGAVRRGATGRTLRVGRALAGHALRCRVTATNAAGSATATSRAVRVG